MVQMHSVRHRREGDRTPNARQPTPGPEPGSSERIEAGGLLSTLSTNIVMDLYADFAAACSKELQAAGYTPPGGTTADLIRAYANVKHRRVSVRPRKVHKASYSVPSPLAAGEQAFLAAVAAGDDLLPHQSTRLEDHAFDDGMLNDFGIHHFHLGTVPYARNPKFRDRRDPLLFAVVRPDDLYVIGYYKHQEWAKRDLLDVIHAMWPDLLAAAIPGIAPQPLGFNASDADIKNFRKAAINPITQRPDGTPHVSPGGGAALDGTSARVEIGRAHV